MKKIALTALGAALLLTSATPAMARTTNAFDATGSPTATIDNVYVDQIGANTLNDRLGVNLQGLGSNNVNMTNTHGSVIANPGRRDVSFITSDTDAIGGANALNLIDVIGLVAGTNGT